MADGAQWCMSDLKEALTWLLRRERILEGLSHGDLINTVEGIDKKGRHDCRMS